MDSEDRARCPILSCGTYLMLERTREGTRAGEGEGGQAARYCCLLRAFQVLWEVRRRDLRSLSLQRLPPGCKTLQKHWASNLASVLARKPRPPEKLGSGAGAVPGTLVASLCVRLRVECLLARAARSLSRRVLHLLAVVSGCQAAGASSGTARTTDDWSHLHC